MDNKDIVARVILPLLGVREIQRIAQASPFVAETVAYLRREDAFANALQAAKYDEAITILNSVRQWHTDQSMHEALSRGVGRIAATTLTDSSKNVEGMALFLKGAWLIISPATPVLKTAIRKLAAHGNADMACLSAFLFTHRSKQRHDQLDRTVAEHKHVESIYLLAKLYHDRSLLRRAVDLNNAAASCLYACRTLREGHQDYLYYLKQASDRGHVPAQLKLSAVYLNGSSGTTMDMDKSRKLFLKALEHPDRYEEYIWSHCRTIRDHDEGIRRLVIAADKGIGLCAQALAVHYNKPHGDHAKTLYYYEKALTAGGSIPNLVRPDIGTLNLANPPMLQIRKWIQSHLADLYMEGDGVGDKEVRASITHRADAGIEDLSSARAMLRAFNDHKAICTDVYQTLPHTIDELVAVCGMVVDCKIEVKNAPGTSGGDLLTAGDMLKTFGRFEQAFRAYDKASDLGEMRATFEMVDMLRKGLLPNSKPMSVAEVQEYMTAHLSYSTATSTMKMLADVYNNTTVRDHVPL